MTYVLGRDGLAACPDDPLRVSAPHNKDVDLCPELVWHGLAAAVRAERPFMGKSHTWWQDLILDAVYEKCAHQVDHETLKEFES